MTDLAVPTVHLNGTAKASLLEAYLAALDKLREAITALDATGPNGRDYYTQGYIRGDAALTKAQAEHRARYERLEAVRAELEEIALAVSDQ